MNGQEFRRWRKGMKLTQVEAGQVLGVSARSIVAWEQDAVPITWAIELATHYLSEHPEVAHGRLDAEGYQPGPNAAVDGG